MMKNYLRIEYANSPKGKSLFEKNSSDIKFCNIRSNFLKLFLAKMSSKFILTSYFVDI